MPRREEQIPHKERRKKQWEKPDESGFTVPRNMHSAWLKRQPKPLPRLRGYSTQGFHYEDRRTHSSREDQHAALKPWYSSWLRFLTRAKK